MKSTKISHKIISNCFHNFSPSSASPFSYVNIYCVAIQMARGHNYDSVESDTDGENQFNKNAGWMTSKYWRIFYIGTLILLSFLLYVIFEENKPLVATLVNMAHGIITYVSFHYRTGTELGGADDTGMYDSMTFWQQLDGGYSWTPTKKFLTVVPILL